MYKQSFLTGVVLSAVLCLTMPQGVAHGDRETILAAMEVPDMPPKETLSPEALATVLQSWDAAVRSNDLRAISAALRLVAISVPRGYRLEGCQVLRYDNPEIEERVIALFLAEMENARIHEQGGSLADIGIAVPHMDGIPYEGYQDYLDSLVPIAELTFSLSIYDAVLKEATGAGTRSIYLATVDPGKILGLLLESVPRERTDPNQSPDMLDHRMEDVHFSVQSAIEFVQVLLARSPDVVLARRDEVVEFLRKHSLHYATPVELPYQPEPVYRSVLDYGTRVFALRALEAIGGASDMYELVDDLARDAPPNPAHWNRSEIEVLVKELVEQIQSL